MKLNRIYFLQELLVTQINHLIFYPLAMTFVSLFKGLLEPVRPSLTVWILCGFLSLLFYWARCNLNRFFPLLAVHLAVVGGVAVLLQFHTILPGAIFRPWDNSINRAASLLLVAGFAIYSLFLRLHEETVRSNMLPMPLAVGIAAVSLYLQHYQGLREWDSYYKLVLILVFGLYFLHYYIKEYLNFLVVNASSTGVLPEKEIFHSGVRLAFGYTLLGVIILAGTSQFAWLKTILDGIKQIIYAILRFLFSLFPRQESRTTELLLDEKVSGGSMELPEAGEPGLIWKILEVIACLAVLVGILFLLYKAIARAIAFVKKAMSRIMKTTETELTGIQDVREKCETARDRKRTGHARDFFGFLDAGERIRRIYKKKAAAYKPLSLSETETKQKSRYNPERVMFYTAREMEHEMQAEPFAEIYEKARYSNETCNGQDVKRMKELCR